MKKSLLLKAVFLVSIFLSSFNGWGQTILYSENFGSGTSFPAGWSSTNTTNGWAVSTSSSSSSYSGNSGSSNVLFNGTGTNGVIHYLTYSNTLSTAGYNNITVLWGGRGTASYVGPVTFQWSPDGTTWNTVSFTDVTYNASWALVNGGTRISLPAGAAGITNLRLRWYASAGNSGNYRIDDVSVQGTLASATVTRSNLTGVIVPQYICDGSSYPTSYVFRATLSGLTASTTYRYYTQLGLSADIGTTNPGAGNPIFMNTSTYSSATPVSFTTAGQYSTITTDASGNYTGWFGVIPTSNSRFTSGQTLYPIVGIANTSGTAVGYYMADINSSITTLAYGTSTAATNYNCSALRGSSSSTAKNLIFVYDTIACGTTQRPISGTIAESDGLTNSTDYSNNSPTWYTSNVDATSGAWGCIIPNTLARGIRRIEQRDYAAGTVSGCASSYNGVWATGSVNTVNPTNSSTTALAISATDAPLSSCNTITTTSTVLGPYCNSTTYNITLPYTITGGFTGQYNIQYSDVNGTFPNNASSNLCSFVSGAVGSTVTATLPSGLTAGTKYRFRVVNPTPAYFTSCDNGSDITINAAPTTPSCSTPAAVCQGLTATITGTGSTGATNYSYWTATSGGSAITTLTTPPGTVSSGNMTTPTTLVGGSYIYYVQGDNATCSSAARQAVTVTITAAPADPAGTVTPAANPACTSTSVSYSSPLASIYWETSATGTSTSNPTTTPWVLYATATEYARTYNGTCWSLGAVNSGVVTINTSPTITTQPSNSSITVGSNTTFSIVASTATGYQWQLNSGSGFNNITNGVGYSNATTATLTITGATLAMSGYTYQCVIAGSAPCPSTTSSTATLTVTPVPVSIWSNPITNSDPSATNPFTSGDVKDANIVVSGISRGSSIAAASASNRFSASSWPTASIRDLNSYFQFTLTANSGYAINFTDLVYTGQASGSGPTSFALYSSLDNYATAIGTATGTGSTISLSAANYQTITAAITFRFYAFNASSGSGTYSINDFTFDGTVVATCTTPTALVFTTQPISSAQDATIPVVVSAQCSNGYVATGVNTGSVSITTIGCGMQVSGSTVTTASATFVNGVATFNNLSFARSLQNNLTLTTTNTGSGFTLTNATSSSFNITAPAGSTSNTTIKNETFDAGNTPWSYSASDALNQGTGSNIVGVVSTGSSFNNALAKTYTLDYNNNTSIEAASLITFTNVTGLSTYSSVVFKFAVASLNLTNSNNGEGFDTGESMYIEISTDGGSTWQKILVYNGHGNTVFPFSSSTVTNLSPTATVTYDPSGGTSSQLSSFSCTLPSGTTQFKFRFYAMDNRTEEYLAIDNIQLIGTTTAGGVQKPLPSASGLNLTACPSTATSLSVATLNTQGTVGYSWSPSPADATLSSTTSANPSASPAVSTTYTTTITDVDFCSATAADVITTTPPSGALLLAPATISLQEVLCPDASGWTYYADPADLTKWQFAIYKNTNNFVAAVDITVKTAAPTAYDLVKSDPRKKATYTMGRYWNAVVTSGSINPAKPIKVRFYYDPTDTLTMSNTAKALAISYGTSQGVAVTTHIVEWVKTNTGITYLPSNNTYSDVPNRLPMNSYTTTQGTTSGIAYTEYGNLLGFSGGTAGIRVSPYGYALPVELLYLNATPVDNQFIKLDWATASEISNRGFELERSTDGVHFENIAWIDGHDNSTSQINYTFADHSVLPNTIYYYRLKQIDIDGHFEYSSVVSSVIIGDHGFVFEELKPNPATDKVVVNVIAISNETTYISVSNILGQEVLHQNWGVQPGLNGTELDLSSLSTGSYLVTVKSAANSTTKRLVISR